MQWSDELHRIHGVDPWDFAGDLDAHLALVVADDRRAVAERLRATPSSTAAAFEVEYDIVRPDGERCRRLYSRAEPALGPDGGVIGLRGVDQREHPRLGAGPVTTTT